jgi:hypothetical protein
MNSVAAALDPGTPPRGPGNRAGGVLCFATTGADVASQYRIERDRGTKEAPQRLSVLRERWPLAFPVRGEDVRPLAIGAAREIAAAMGLVDSLHARRA